MLLVVLGVVGTAGVLAYDQHWDGTWQLVPWGICAGISIALAAILVRPTRSMVWLARILAVLTIVAAMLGEWRHFVNGAEKLGHWGGGIVYHLPDDLGP